MIIGSGAGGATIAKELSRKGISVTVLEKGRFFKSRKLRSRRFPESIWSYEKSCEGVEILRAIVVGGSSIVSLANGPRALEQKLMAYGINPKHFFKETEKELRVAPLPQRFVGERTRMLLSASEECGYKSEPIPKFIDYTRCKSCGMCVNGCLYGAKWTAEAFVREAQSNGAEFLTGVTVEKVLHSNGEVKGLSVRKESETYDVEAEVVVVAAGGIGTPIILQKSGLDEAGNNLFAGLNVVTWGLIKDPVKSNEISMAAMIKEKPGVMVAPFFLGKKSIWHDFLERTLLSSLLMKPPFRRYRTLGLITKIADDNIGTVGADGSISKSITQCDRSKLDKGVQISRDILLRAGVKPESIEVTSVQGSHPGGTARIGHVVNKDFETRISRLFVSDASILPESPGQPPLLTIVALAKRFADILVSEYT